MDEIEQSAVDTQNDETEVEVETEQPEQTEAPKKEYTVEQKLARINRMKAKLEKELGITPPKAEVKPAPTTKTGELDETQLDYLDLKGISDESEIDLIQTVMQKTGMTVRQALKDEYVQEKLTKLRDARAVKDATPSATKRGNSSTQDSVAVALTKYESTGQLPTDFALRAEVVKKLMERDNSNKPSWR